MHPHCQFVAARADARPVHQRIIGQERPDQHRLVVGEKLIEGREGQRQCRDLPIGEVTGFATFHDPKE